MTTRASVLKMVFMPSSAFFPTSAKAGPRWSITGKSIARKMRSGTLDGPGICRKWRPAVIVDPPRDTAPDPVLRGIAAPGRGLISLN